MNKPNNNTTDMIFHDGLPELLSPREDGIFKAILTQGNSYHILKGIIAAITSFTVKTVTIGNTELPISNLKEKRERLDIFCEVSDGENDFLINIEMQTNTMSGDSHNTGFLIKKNRDVYYACDMHSRQNGVGVEYDKLRQSYHITLCGYRMFRDAQNIHRFSLRDEQGNPLCNALNIIYMELPKFKDTLKKPVDEMTKAEKWAIFFGYVDHPIYYKTVGVIIEHEEEIKMAYSALTGISQSLDERAKYMARAKYEGDMAHERLYKERILREAEAAKKELKATTSELEATTSELEATTSELESSKEKAIRAVIHTALSFGASPEAAMKQAIIDLDVAELQVRKYVDEIYHCQV